VKKANLPVAWVQIRKAYVSYHLMGIYGMTGLLKGMSKEFKARMQGRTCFNFNTCNDAMYSELDFLTGQAIAAFKEAGYITEAS
jgi:hypothetical protein